MVDVEGSRHGRPRAIRGLGDVLHGLLPETHQEHRWFSTGIIGVRVLQCLFLVSTSCCRHRLSATINVIVRGSLQVHTSEHAWTSRDSEMVDETIRGHSENKRTYAASRHAYDRLHAISAEEYRQLLPHGGELPATTLDIIYGPRYQRDREIRGWFVGEQFILVQSSARSGKLVGICSRGAK